MKLLSYILGFLAVALVALSFVFNTFEIKGSDLLLTVSLFAFTLLFLPAMFIANYGKSKETNTLYLRALETGIMATLALGTLFRFKFWTGANILMGIGVAIMLVYFLILIIHSVKQSEVRMRYLTTGIVLFFGIGLFLQFGFKSVSSSIVNAVILLDNELNASGDIFKNKNKLVYAAFAQSEFPAQVYIYKKNADEVKSKTEQLYNSIQQMKQDMILLADGPKGELNNLRNKTNTEVTNEYMIFAGNGEKLKNKIKLHREFLLAMIDKEDETIRQIVLKSQQTPDTCFEGMDICLWEKSHFKNQPLVAGIALLTSVQVKLRITESEIISYMYNQIQRKNVELQAIKNSEAEI